MPESREIHLVSAAHADALHALFSEPDVAAVAGIGVAPSPEEIADYIGTAITAQADGRSYVFVLVQGPNVLGICRLIGVMGVPRLIVATASAHRGRGHGSFLVRHVLEFAFEALQLDQVTATGPCLVLVSRYGRLDGNALKKADWKGARITPSV